VYLKLSDARTDHVRPRQSSSVYCKVCTSPLLFAATGLANAFNCNLYTSAPIDTNNECEWAYGTIFEYVKEIGYVTKEYDRA